ncbi:MAG: AI-2E family transporter [Patescibacteria group bacterium]|jgi:predicted PurR-regulated permease PerM
MGFNPRQYFFLTLLIVSAALVVAMFFSYLQALALATALAIVFRPFYRWLRKQLRGYEAAAAFLTVIIAIGLVLIPLVVIGGLIFIEARGVVANLNFSNDLGLDRNTVKLLHQFFPGFPGSFASYSTEIARWFTSNINALLSSTLSVLINFFICILGFFYLLKDGDRLSRVLVKWSPLTDSTDYELFNRLETAIHSILTGSLVVGAVQGIIAGIGFALFGLPNPALWGTVTAFAALIPGIGSAIVVVPAILYVAITGTPVQTIGLILWGSIFVGLIDNVIRPHVISRGFNVHPFLVLLSVIGGLSFFGALGVLFGPMALALLFALIDMSEHFMEENKRA